VDLDGPPHGSDRYGRHHELVLEPCPDGRVAVLLDVSPDPALSGKIAARLEQRGDRLSDLHLWRVGPGHIAAIVSVVTDHPEPSSAYKKRLSDLPGLSPEIYAGWRRSKMAMPKCGRSKSRRWENR
jgi:hypothetical protein